VIDLIVRERSLAEAYQELLQELLRRLHMRVDKSENMVRDLRNELNSMRLNLHAHQNDLNNLYAMHSKLDERMERIEARLDLREFSEAQARFEPHP
jgi:flagellar biosynthesis chaperone FliJ